MSISQQARKRHVRPLFFRISVIIMLFVALLACLHTQASRAQAAGAIIHWDSSMIYPGENNGFPWGPVGENAIVHGERFTPNQEIKLALAPGNSLADPTVCKNTIATVATATVDSSGKFDQNFKWPAAASQVNSAYSICGLLAADGSVVSSQDDGPFTVLSANPPSISISTTTATAGDTVTITGQNWVPPQKIGINIAGCADCEPGSTEVTSATTTSTGQNEGNFSVTVTIPATTKAGNYVVDALTQSGMDANYTTGVQHLTINAAAPQTTPTDTASPTPTDTTTPTVTASPTAATTPTDTTSTASTSTSDSNGGDGGSGLLIGIIVVVVLLLLAGTGTLIYLMKRGKTSPGTPAPGASGSRAGLPPQSPMAFQQRGNTPPHGTGQGNYMPPHMAGQSHYAPQSMAGQVQFNQAGPVGTGYSQPQSSQFSQSGTGFAGYNQPQQPQFPQTGSSLAGFGQPQQPQQQPTQFYSDATMQMTSQSMAGPGMPGSYGNASSFCGNCGQPLPPQAVRCTHCGMSVGTQAGFGAR